MKLRSAIFLLFAILPFYSFAQGVITVFSEDGDKFFLIINGVKQNPDPQTNVRVDGLVAVNYKAKIIFEDASKEPVSSNVYTQNALTHEYVEATYRIKRTKKGDLKLRLYSSTPVPPNFTPAPDMYMVHYGAAPQIQTVQTTTTTTSGGNNASINVNVPSVNMHINAGSDNAGVNLNMNVNGSAKAVNRQQELPANSRPAVASDCHWPMENGAFQTFLAGMKQELSTTVQANMATALLANNCISTDQAIEICKAFLYDLDMEKLRFAKRAYPRVTDQGNYQRLIYVFQDDLRRKEFKTFMDNGGRE